MKVVILAGGYGTRISEYSKNYTKANDQDWWAPYDFSYYETLFKIWF